MPKRITNQDLNRVFPTTEDGRYRMTIRSLADGGLVEPTSEVMSMFGYVPSATFRKVATDCARLLRIIRQQAGKCPVCHQTGQCLTSCTVDRAILLWEGTSAIIEKTHGGKHG